MRQTSGTQALRVLTWDAGGLHPRGGVHRVAKDCEFGQLEANQPGHLQQIPFSMTTMLKMTHTSICEFKFHTYTRSSVKPDPDLHRQSIVRH